MGLPHHLREPGVKKWLRRRYGGGPLHLLSLLASLGFAGYVVNLILQVPEAIRILIWFVGAAVLHDLILWPLYAIADQGATRLHRRRAGQAPPIPWINHVRVPVVLSAVMLAISFPLVLHWSEPAYHTASGLTENVYFGRWLLLSGAAFALSALLYAVRVGRYFSEKRPNRGATPER
jgi:hypothetical protein